MDLIKLEKEYCLKVMKSNFGSIMTETHCSVHSHVGLQYQGFWIILILQDKTLFNALEAGDIVCWLVNQPIAKLDLFKSFDCRWICKTYAEYCYRNSATVRRLVQSPTLQSTIFCSVHSGLRGKGIRVSPAWQYC